jgi:ISXO2-like transposase domain
VQDDRQVRSLAVEQSAHLMSDEWKSFVSVGQCFANHETGRHSCREYARRDVHANSAEGFNDRVRRTVSAVFHHISPEHADLYLGEIGFRWPQRIVSGQAVRQNRKGRKVIKTIWSRITPALQLSTVFRSAVGHQLRRTPKGGILSKSNVAVFG